MYRRWFSLLALVAGVQMFLLLLLRAPEDGLGGLQLDRPMPVVEVVPSPTKNSLHATVWGGLTTATQSPIEMPLVHDTCSLIVIASRHCGICLAMRETWQRDLDSWSISNGVHVRPFWLFLDPPGTLEAFADHAEMGLIPVASITGPGRSTGGRVLGVVGTPTTLLVDEDGVYRVGVMGDILPPGEVAARWCSA